MSDMIQYFNLWAPYWSEREDTFLSKESVETLSNLLKSPVLLVGAGLGLMIEKLQTKGLQVDGIELSPQMVKYAKKLRNLELIQGDAREMPIKDNTYESSLIATGVIDVMDDLEAIERIIEETKRVTISKGPIYAAFYHWHPMVTDFLKTFRYLSSDGRWLYRKSHELWIVKPNEVFPILKKQNPNLSFVKTLLILLKVQFFLPKKEKQERKDFMTSWKKACESMEDPHKLIESGPETVPYRNEKAIKQLFEKLNIQILKIQTFPSCKVVQIQ
jgi:ubiquinone/menaquinone biosynthesis C-methylase UbiE